jgi:1-aminocyclopropane-1-carboxylate deaminase
MELSFVSRSDYKLLRQYKNCHDLPALKRSQYWVPEGGAQILALKGVAELVNEIDITYNILCVPCGTGATLAGIINAAPEKASIWGFAALKNAAFLESDVASLLPKISSDNWKVNLDYHFGGFAKKSTELLDFISNFEDKTGIPLESVYTGKMLFGIYDLITKHTFKPGQRIIAIHTGGLQGKRGFTK